jgi:hypothetical protein
MSMAVTWGLVSAQIEGQEIDKVLAFYPPEVAPNEQTALVGLVQAMLAFTSLFSPVRPPPSPLCHSHLC